MRSTRQPLQGNASIAKDPAGLLGRSYANSETAAQLFVKNPFKNPSCCSHKLNAPSKSDSPLLSTHTDLHRRASLNSGRRFQPFPGHEGTFKTGARRRNFAYLKQDRSARAKTHLRMFRLKSLEHHIWSSEHEPALC